ncbi:MAG: dihydropteroate synthase [Parvibaculum sp.]|uniref:dihydropteroate synthase n=1 Tax=Parvibaculum sp. TaxID=2024848 RepID=UPI00271F7102|nr:dihydropteroate synthase [Parvibaculum sp.]MDO8839409.1 dihydropteroate synthase [Parvibaculum sp.]
MFQRPQIFGILNITPDSFSDGGRYFAADAAIVHARQLIADGADVIDIGPASSNPDAAPVPAEEEIRRIAPVIEALANEELVLSVDSFRPETQAYALAHGARYLNDIQGFDDAHFHPALAVSGARLILMHSIQERGNADRRAAPEGDIVERICRFFEERIGRLERAGVARDRLVLDPGMGFFLGPKPETSFEVLARLGELKSRFGLPLLVSVSRKSFLRAVTSRAPQEAGPASLAAELLAAIGGADYIRTHEPRPLADALTVYGALKGQG